MKRLTYFVPVDFDECSYNALQYAGMLARLSGGKVNICHVIDLDEAPDSDNPVVVSFALERIERRVNEKMKSLRELISLEGVDGESQVVMGNVRLELINQINRMKPQVIVMGRNTDRQPRRDSLLSYITRNTKVPVLVVPCSHNPKIPNRTVLATDLKPGRIGEYAPLFHVIKKTSQTISIINVERQASQNGTGARAWLGKLNSTYDIDAQFLSSGSDDVIHYVERLIQDNLVDLICTVKRKNGFPGWLFRKEIQSRLISEVNIPVLLIKG